MRYPAIIQQPQFTSTQKRHVNNRVPIEKLDTDNGLIDAEHSKLLIQINLRQSEQADYILINTTHTSQTNKQLVPQPTTLATHTDSAALSLSCTLSCTVHATTVASHNRARRARAPTLNILHTW